MRSLILMAFSVAALCGAGKFGKGLTLKESTPLATFLVRGKVTEVCQMMGCWMQIQDGEILFPKDGAERGQKFDGSKIKSGMTIYQIQGTGAVLLD